jgi:hypothetical protein
VNRRTAARLLLALTSTAAFFVLAEVLYRAIAAEEVDEKNLHQRFRIYYQDANRDTVDAAAAARRGMIVPVPDGELQPVAEVLRSDRVGFGPGPAPGQHEIVAPSTAWRRDKVGTVRWDGPVVMPGERVRVLGSALNDGYRTALAFEVRATPGTGEEVGVLIVTPPLTAEAPGASVTIETYRSRMTWAPGQTFHLCYAGLEQDGERAAYFDAQGCVPCEINSAGLREREEVIGPKPAGQRRVVCIGDSFTFGWGVRVEDAWPRRVERALRARDDGVRTVNCGAAGAIYVDEYAAALAGRFGRFEPDLVLVSLCLNDLIPSNNSLAHAEPPPWLLRRSRILRDLFQGYALAASLRIDPARDLVGELLALPDERYPVWATAVPPNSVGRAALWPGGTPQRGLLAMRDWCRERKVGFAVVVWPYFQGLGAAEPYPFAPIHRMVGEFCGAEGIPFLDLLPSLDGRVEHSSELWVCAADYHGNERAQAMASPALTAFVAELLGLGD